MTRIKEQDPNSGVMPDYKSPLNRIVHSLRQGYDNVRRKLQDAREQIKYFQIKSRDLEKSRTRYKDEVIVLKEKISRLEKENEKLKMQFENSEIKKKKLGQ